MTKKELVDLLVDYSDDSTVVFFPSGEGINEKTGEQITYENALAISDPEKGHELIELGPIGIVQTVDMSDMELEKAIKFKMFPKG